LIEMRERYSALERALSLAKSGEMSRLTELRACLHKEGYGIEADAIWGKGLKRQLTRLMADAKVQTSTAPSGAGV
jgi:hypothetical protein